MTNSFDIYQKRINRVIDHVTKNLDRAISLEELAEVAYFSPFHFHRIFVAMTGESVNFFTNRVRLEKAARLLKYSQEAIGGIAIDCGFSSPATFSRAFKQYFHLSPSAYRKTGEFENSKIRKELFPMEDYIAPMTLEEKVAAFPVEIKEFPERKVAYIRVMDSYREGVVIGAFRQMIDWATGKGIYELGTIFGMSIDDPLTTPQQKCRYEVCLTLPSDFKMNNSGPIQNMSLPKCTYGTSKVSGAFSHVATAIHYLFNDWLLNSAYEPAHQHGLEIFRNKEDVCNWDYLDLELCIPIKSLKKF